MNVIAEPPQRMREWSRVDPARIIYYSHANESIIGEIRYGILFVMAHWSGSAIQAFAKLTETLAALDPQGKLQLIVVDTDGVPALYDHAVFLGKMHGAGETAWIKDGVIQSTSLMIGPSCFEKNTRELLSLA